jgi:iron complex transport system permease protein
VRTAQTRPVRVGGWSLRVAPRTAATGVALLLAVAAVWFVALFPAPSVMSAGEVLNTLSGSGSAGDEAVVYGWQMPRALTAVLVGFALGLSGAIFQSITRNPLGSPEIVGFTTGAATGALVSLTLVGTTVLPTWLGSFAGAALSAALILLVARGGLRVYRMVLVGVGINAILLAVNSYLLSQADFYDARSAATWLIGSIDGRGWGYVTTLGPALAVLVPVVLCLGPVLRMLELGDDQTLALGVPVNAARLALVVAGVALVGVAVTAAGPIAFVSLTAPHLTKMLCRSGNRPLLPSALMGSLLLVVSDLLATKATAHLLPVGVVTGVLGGSYLAWLLIVRRA